MESLIDLYIEPKKRTVKSYVFRSHARKARVSFFDRLLSVVRPSVDMYKYWSLIEGVYLYFKTKTLLTSPEDNVFKSHTSMYVHVYQEVNL